MADLGADVINNYKYIVRIHIRRSLKDNRRLNLHDFRNKRKRSELINNSNVYKGKSQLIMSNNN